jgi:hypothetical protein
MLLLPWERHGLLGIGQLTYSPTASAGRIKAILFNCMSPARATQYYVMSRICGQSGYKLRSYDLSVLLLPSNS